MFPSPLGEEGFSALALRQQTMQRLISFPSPLGEEGFSAWWANDYGVPLRLVFPSPLGEEGFSALWLRIRMQQTHNCFRPLSGKKAFQPHGFVPTSDCTIDVSVPSRGRRLFSLMSSMSSRKIGWVFPSPLGEEGFSARI